MLTTHETRRSAHEAIKPCAKTMRAQVLAAIVAAGVDGLTDDEIQQQLGLQGSSERPRRIELQQAEMITQSGEVRPTASGRKAVCWVATVKGIQQ